MKVSFLSIAAGLLLSPVVPVSSILGDRSRFLKSSPSIPSASSPVIANAFDPPTLGSAATAVTFPNWDGPVQHSGFLRFTGVRPSSSPEINTFFWLLPSLNNDPAAPVMIWLQGGPGSSSLYGMFEELGPMGIDANMNVFPRDPLNNWNQEYSLLFLDNPVGVGFSFAESDDAYVSNEQQVGTDLRSCLLEFYKVFPDLRSNALYVTGESYAGKYVPALSYAIYKANKKGGLKIGDDDFINLKGLSIGDGAMSPPDQFDDFGNLLYYVGMISKQEKQVFDQYETNIQARLQVGDTIGAFEYFDEMLNGDFTNGVTYYHNVTSANYFNFEQGECGNCSPSYYDSWLVTPAVRDLIHVGGCAYNGFNQTVEEHLKADWMVGVLDMLVPLMQDPDVHVLIYSGANDVILGPPLTENFLEALQWDGSDAYAKAHKNIWTIDGEVMANDPVAGYVKHVEEFKVTYAVVRGAGHMVPTDQPERAYDLIKRFVNDDFKF